MELEYDEKKLTQIQEFPDAATGLTVIIGMATEHRSDTPAQDVLMYLKVPPKLKAKFTKNIRALPENDIAFAVRGVDKIVGVFDRLETEWGFPVSDDTKREVLLHARKISAPQQGSEQTRGHFR